MKSASTSSTSTAVSWASSPAPISSSTSTPAGYGWFIDETPGESSEFLYNEETGGIEAIAGGPADGQMDLLTVVTHELGHALGYGDTYDPAASNDLMYGFLDTGERKVSLDLDFQVPDNTAPANSAAADLGDLVQLGGRNRSDGHG